MRKGEGVTERVENRGSEGGVLGPRRGLWVVVVGVHRRSWWWALDLPSAVLSWRDVAVDGWGRGDVESTSRQPPVGGRRWAPPPHCHLHLFDAATHNAHHCHVRVGDVAAR